MRRGPRLLATRLLWTWLAAGLAACSRPDDGTADPARPRPARHLLLITIDTLRADRLSCYGGRAGVSPNIDRLASEGVRVETAYAPMGMTLACVTSLMTSKYPDEHGITYNQMTVLDGERLLAERLADAGFSNRAWVANGVVDARSGLAQGYADVKRDYLRVDDEDRLTRDACRFLRREFGKDGRREFTWLHYMAPHAPYDPAEEHWRLFDPDYDGDLDGTAESLDPIYIEKRELSQRDLEHILALYDGEVHQVDEYVGRVLDALEDSGEADDTLVVLTADHGEELYDRNAYFYHANSLYASVTHVPLILRLPGRVPRGHVLEGIVELVDVLPTALDYLGIPAADGDPATKPRGHDLRRAIEGGRVEKELAFSQILSRIYLVRSDRWSFVRNPEGYEPISVPEEGRYFIDRIELYDLLRDPGERKNVAGRHPDVVEQMERRLDAWSYRLHRWRPRTAPKLSEERLRELEQLGYIAPRGEGRRDR